jgi:hypothetical protein
MRFSETAEHKPAHAWNYIYKDLFLSVGKSYNNIYIAPDFIN